MKPSRSMCFVPVAAVLLMAGCGGGDRASQADAANPCAANPCAAAAANPCAANPCAAAAANPCAANPCAAAGMLDAAVITQGDRVLNTRGMSRTELVARGVELWDDKSLSRAGTTACSSCHTSYAMMNASFSEPYPHPVKMAKERAGMDEVTAAEMVQLCMVIPMAAEPLDWESVDLAALAAHVEDIQSGFKGRGGMNPCAANPCAADAANPCAANPYAADAANPCAANPCVANPCGGK